MVWGLRLSNEFSNGEYVTENTYYLQKCKNVTNIKLFTSTTGNKVANMLLISFVKTINKSQKGIVFLKHKV